jgi:pyrroline-5-carboxylate reductase
LKKVSLLGAGNMGSAMLRGWLETGTLHPAGVKISDRDDSRAAGLARSSGASKADSNPDAARWADIVVLAVKPQDSAGVLDEIAGDLGAGKVLVSIVAGLTIGSIRSRIGGGPSVVRVMPNLGAQVGAAVSGYSVDAGEGEFDPRTPVSLIEAIGEIVEVDERWLDLVTALSGSGPAYFFLLAEAMEDAAVDMGLPADTARVLARETLWGAAKVLKETGSDAAELRRAVSSPGGTTLAALEVMEKESFAGTVARAMEAARRRAGELST